MQRLISMLSDLDLERELISGLKNRVVDQKFGYMNEGARMYYDALAPSGAASADMAQSRFDMIAGGLPKVGRSAVISLGCGNAEQERELLARLKAAGHDFDYFGIDSSRSMLDLAAATLSGAEYRREFVLADITTDEFRDEITRQTSGYDTRVFAFLGSTFGNTNQTHMVDSLWNVLKPSDTLWLHVLVRPSLKTVDDMRLFNRYAAYLANERMMERFFFPLRAVGIPFGNGKMQLASDKEESVGAMVFKFSFVFSAKTVISCRDEKLHFLPGEKIDLISIRVYHERTLVNFFLEHEFNFKSVQCEPLSAEVVRGQFLFKKNA